MQLFVFPDVNTCLSPTSLAFICTRDSDAPWSPTGVDKHQRAQVRLFSGRTPLCPPLSLPEVSGPPPHLGWPIPWVPGDSGSSILHHSECLHASIGSRIHTGWPLPLVSFPLWGYFCGFITFLFFTSLRRIKNVKNNKVCTCPYPKK